MSKQSGNEVSGGQAREEDAASVLSGNASGTRVHFLLLFEHAVRERVIKPCRRHHRRYAAISKQSGNECGQAREEDSASVNASGRQVHWHALSKQSGNE
jgi:hypothetical protein